MQRLRILLLLVALVGAVHSAAPADFCKIIDQARGNSYDLTPLIQSTGRNWETSSSDGKYKYLLNPCGTLLPQTISTDAGKSKTCASGVEVCQVDMANADQDPKDMGHLNNYLAVLDDGVLQLNFTDGQLCPRKQRLRQTSILFTCDKNAGKGTPIFQIENNYCQYFFTWATAYACPKSTPSPSSAPIKNCEVVDQTNKLRYDLTSLANSVGNYIVTSGTDTFWLNVCTDVRLSGIPSGYGAVVTKANSNTKVLLGQSSARPVIDNGVLKLSLKNGEFCGDEDDPSARFQATIIFECKSGEGLGTPRFIEMIGDCHYLFSWKSAAACGEPLANQCSASDPATGKTVDLSALTKSPTSLKNWEALSVAGDGDEFRYLLNVCDDLVDAQNPCREGTTICQVAIDAPTTGRSLGNKGTLVANNGDVILRYTDGDACPAGNGATRVSTDIYFICDPTSLGTPRLLSVKNDCQYLFNWKTSAACEVNGTPTQAPITSGGLSVGAIVTIVIFSLIFGYFIIGSVVNKFARGKEGLDVIPHWDLFQAIYYTCLGACTGGRRPPTGAIQI